MDEFMHKMHLEGRLAQSVKVNYDYMRLHQQQRGGSILPAEGPPVPCAGWGLDSPPTWLGKEGSRAVQTGEPAIIQVARPLAGARISQDTVSSLS